MISGSRVHKTHLTMKLAFVTVELYPEHKVGWRNMSEVFLLLHGGKNSVGNCHLLSSLHLLLMINCCKEQLTVFQKNCLCTCIDLSSYPPPP